MGLINHSCVANVYGHVNEKKIKIRDKVVSGEVNLENQLTETHIADMMTNKLGSVKIDICEVT